MSKLKLLHGISRVRRAKLQTSIDQTIADDVELLAEWSNNETQYVVNELLRFALAQEEDFQKHKTALASNGTRIRNHTKAVSASIPSVTESGAKSDLDNSSPAAQV